MSPLNARRGRHFALVPEQEVRAADFLALTCPLKPETTGLINAEVLSLMKPTARLINVARGRSGICQASSSRRILPARRAYEDNVIDILLDNLRRGETDLQNNIV
jgi:D-2-hydroxyacid dehydrogenase (NADP+)